MSLPLLTATYREPRQSGYTLTMKYLEQGNLVHLLVHCGLSLKSSCFLLSHFEL